MQFVSMFPLARLEVRKLYQNGLVRRLLAGSKRDDNGCLVWFGTKPNNYGYGKLSVDNKQHYVHRLAYEIWVGPITNECIDHLCANRLCIEPSHLEQTTLAENTRRGCDRNRTSHCPKGHEYTPENTYRHPKGWRYCRECHRKQERARTVRKPIREKVGG